MTELCLVECSTVKIGSGWVLQYMWGVNLSHGCARWVTWALLACRLLNFKAVVVVVWRKPYFSQSHSGRGTAQIRGKPLLRTPPGIVQQK